MIFIVLFALTKLLLSQVFLGTMKLRVNNKSHWFIKSFKSFFFCSTGKAASRSNSCPRILLCGDDDSHTRHLGPALLHSLEHLPCHLLDITTLFEETGKAAEEALIQVIITYYHRKIINVKIEFYIIFYILYYLHKKES